MPWIIAESPQGLAGAPKFRRISLLLTDTVDEAGDGDRVADRDQGDVEAAPLRLDDGQADPVDRDRALLDQVALQAGIDLADYLARHDATTVLERLGDAITTGATGTNVNDLKLLIFDTIKLEVTIESRQMTLKMRILSPRTSISGFNQI